MVCNPEVSIPQIKSNLSKWENEVNPLAPLSSQERDTIIEMTSVASWRRSCSSSFLSNVGQSGNNRSNSFGKEPRARPDSFLIESENLKSSSNLYPDTDDRLNSTGTSRFMTSICSIKLESSQEFLNWYASVEEGMEREQDILYKEYILQLEKHRNECRILLHQLTEALENLQNLASQYTSVSTKTNTLHTDCEHLLAEQTRLSNGADTMKRKLTYFLEENNISKKLNSPAFQVNSESFISLLEKINECVNYMNSNPKYKDSSIYLAKYKLCLNRGLSMIKSYVSKSLENMLQEILPQSGTEKSNTDNALILYYGKYRAIAPRIRVLMNAVEDRIESGPEYGNLLSDCHQCYFSQRKILLEPCVLDAVKQLSQKYDKDYCAQVRSGCAFLVHVCEDEHNLFHQFFSLPSSELENFIQGLCFILYDSFRPLIIHIDHLETLSEICNILKRGIIEEHIQNNPVKLVPLTHIVNQLLEDCQERLVYRAHIYMQTDIAHFNPSPGDLAYPSKLEMMESIAESLIDNQKKMLRKTNGSTSSVTSIRSSGSDEIVATTVSDERFSRVGSSPADLHGMWYPTVRRTLLCLSKLYRSVERSIFQGVCLEALSACMHSLSAAADSISKSSSPLDAQLFEIKHLLILREQMAPFQIDASLRGMTLDWSKFREAALGLVTKRSRIFSLTSNNALLEFIVEGTPQVTEHILDSKRDVDNQLKKVCEQLISTSSERLVSPVTSFTAKVDVFLRMNNEKQMSLSSQPFAAPDKVAECLALAQKNLRTTIPAIQKKLQLYLANKDTEFILFKPIRSSILAAFHKVGKIIHENYTEEEIIIIGCPSQEEISALIAVVFKN